jgi:hypothetical protein
MARVLRPGGRLIISVPGHCYFPDYLDLVGHYRHYSREESSCNCSRKLASAWCGILTNSRG